MSQLDGALGQASDLNSHLQGLLKQLEKMRTHLADHKPPRVQPTHIEKQIKELSVSTYENAIVCNIDLCIP